MNKRNTLTKIAGNFDVLIPFIGIYERFVKKNSTWSIIKTFNQTMISAGITGLYLGMAVGINPNPLKWSETIDSNHLRADSIQNEYQTRKEAFPSQFYQQIAGHDGVIDSTEFMKFYNKADSVGTVNYSRMKETFNGGK